MPMGKYLIKLDKLLSWSLISLHFQYYNHSLLSYNHSHVYIVYHGKQTVEVTFLEQSFSLHLKKLQNIIVLLYLSVFYMHTSEWKFGKNYICRQTASRVAHSHANKSNTVTAKEDTKRKFSYYNVIWALISWFYQAQISKNPKLLTVIPRTSDDGLKFDTAAPEFISIFIFV